MNQMVTGVLLAAGAGRRYGGPKILVSGWLERSVRALREGGCEDVVVVTGAARPALPTAVREVHCPQWERGMGASLRAGLESLAQGVDVAVVHLVDLTDVGGDVVRRVITAGSHGLARAVYDGRPGHPVVINRRYVPPLLEELDDGAGAAGFLQGRPELVEVECADLATGRDTDEPGAGGAS